MNSSTTALPTLASAVPSQEDFNFLEIARVVELEVLAEADASKLDPRRGETREILALIAATVSRQRERGAFDDRWGRELSTYVARSLLGLGPIEEALTSSDVWEIEINAPDQVFIRSSSGTTTPIWPHFYDDAHVERVITRLLDRSLSAHRKLDPSEGIQDAQLANGSRIHIVHQDIARGGHLLVNIRKFLKTSNRSLRHAVSARVIEADVAELLKGQVRNGATVLFAGAPGSGKTTLLTSVANELSPTTRVVCAEEVFETDLSLANVAQMQTRPQRSDRSAVTLRELTSAFLRMSPDAIIVGEVRDREVLPFLMALSSGVQGFSSIHARSARHALERLRFLAQLSGLEVHEGALTQLISESIDLVVHLVRTPSGPRVREVISVESAQVNRDRWSFTTSTLFLDAQRTPPATVTSSWGRENGQPPHPIRGITHEADCTADPQSSQTTNLDHQGSVSPW